MSLDLLKIPTIVRLEDTSLSILVKPEFLQEFQELCHRAGNLWPDASPEMKAFIDLITEGKVQQDYSYIATGDRSLYFPQVKRLLKIENPINKSTDSEK